MKAVLIAEKPSLARNAAIGIHEKFQMNEGYMESENYIVTWAFGHLFELYDIEEYLDGYTPGEKSVWNMNILPFYPEKYKFRLKKDPKTKKTDTDIQKQFNTIRMLLKRRDVSKVYHCGDADREGEVIIREILLQAGNTLPVYRVWVDDQTPQSLAKGIQNARPDSEMDLIAKEGYARLIIDNMYGINLTRYVTLKCGRMLRVGRIISAITKTIYDRDMEIEHFIPEKYFGLVSSETTKGETIELEYPQTFKLGQREEALKKCRELNSYEAVVTNIDQKEKVVSAKKLFSITKLQNEMNHRYKASPDMTLKAAQALYEKGFLSYPRTNTEYLTEGEMDKVKTVLDRLQEKGYKVIFKETKSIFDDSKVESHSALTPTSVFPAQDKLSGMEKQVYDTVLSRFLAVFCEEECIELQSEMMIQSGGDGYKIKGRILKQKGWLQYEEVTKKDKFLPKLEVGDSVNINFKLKDKATQPPKHYTVETLNNFMENPFKADNENEDDAQDYKALLNGLQIGTGATRAGIIHNAIANGYISLEETTYKIAPMGIYYIEVLEKLGISMDKYKTAEVGKILRQVFLGKIGVDESIGYVKQQIDEYFKNRDMEIETAENIQREPIGMCPECGRAIFENSKAYGCSGYKDGCDFTIWKNDKFFAALHKQITPNLVRTLLKNGVVTVPRIKGKKGTYSLKLKYEKKLYQGKIVYGWTKV